MLDFTKKIEMLQDIEMHFNPAKDPTDQKVLTNILGNENDGDEEFDVEKLL